MVLITHTRMVFKQWEAVAPYVGSWLKCCLLQIDSLPISALDASTNLGRSLPFLRLLIGIYGLFHAGRTCRSVSSLEAAMQTVMPHLAVTVTVTRLLMQDARDSGRHLICGHLVRMRKVDAGELISA
jgi:hypothetical protein